MWRSIPATPPDLSVQVYQGYGKDQCDPVRPVAGVRFNATKMVAQWPEFDSTHHQESRFSTQFPAFA
jgi:hypothetical protein